MAQKPVIFLLLVGLSLLGISCLSQTTVQESPELDLSQGELADQISEGEEILLGLNSSTQKQAAADAYSSGNYDQAISLWESTLEQKRNDPETLIYLSNARIADQPVYSIAVPVPGDAEVNVAQEILRGAAQAQFLINSSGGINGKPVKLIIANDRNNPEVAQELAAVFSQDPEILGVIGHFSSNVSLEAAQVYQKEGLVMISPTSSSVALSNVGSYVFRTVSSDCMSGNALATYLTDKMNVTQVAVLFNSASSYSTSLRDVFKSSMEEQDGEIVVEFNFSQPNFNIVNALSKIKQEEAKALIFFPNSSGINALETLDKTFLIAQMNEGELPLLGGDSLYKPRTLQLGQKNVIDMVLVVPWDTENTDSGFVELATNLWGGKVNWRSALAYDATMALGTAIKQSATREGIQQALLEPNFAADGASGEITFLPTGDRAGKVRLVRVKAGTSSGFGYDFVPVADFKYDLPAACQ
ncbi:MAG: ABC transporter substrate-binding protein [Cyanobacteria bacterium P01_C01_bin.72]